MDAETEDSSIDDTMRETLASIESGETSTEVNDEPAEQSAPAVDAPPASEPVSKVAAADPRAAAEPAAPALEPWQQPPKSWKQEMRQYWGQQTPEVMRYIHQREEEALRGITQYKRVADGWSKVLTPYRQQIEQYGIDPYEAVSQLVAVHTILRHGTVEQKARCAELLDRDYGLSQFYAGKGQVQRPVGPDMTPLSNRIASLETQLNQRAFADASSEVEKFLSDSTNKYAAEAAPRMLEILESGQAEDMKAAYDMAVRTDPVLFEKLVSERVAAVTRAPARPPTNTRPSRVPPSTAGRAQGTIEDTMRDTLDRIQNRA